MEPADAWRMTGRLKNELGKGDPFAAAVRATRMPMVVTDPRQADNPIVFCNEAFVRLTGYRRDEIYGRNCRFLQGPDTDRDEVARLRAAVDVRTDVDVEVLNYRKDGTTFWNALYMSPVFNEDGELLYFFASQLDVTRRREADRRLREEKARIEHEVRGRTQDLEARTHDLERTAVELRAALDAKTVLLHEVDHRVKNNLQMVTSLVSVQANRTGEPAVRDALRSVLARLEALSTVHRRLYQAHDVGRFDVADFARDLVADLVGASGRTNVEVRLDLRPVEVAADQAAPVALIVSELVANALRHGFPQDRAGRLSVAVREDEERLRIEVADDGVGMDAAPAGPAAFGLTLVRALARQTRAQVSWADAGPGARATVVLPLSPFRPTVGEEA